MKSMATSVAFNCPPNQHEQVQSPDRADRVLIERRESCNCYDVVVTATGVSNE